MNQDDRFWQDFKREYVDRALWQFFEEVRDAVNAGNQGKAPHPYRHGTFLVTALSGDIEFTVSDITEEDAVLIAGELKDLGVKANVSGTLICQHCGKRVPEQAHCTACRSSLSIN